MAKTWTVAEVRDLWKQLWPDGQLYDWDTPTSWVYRHTDAVAQTLKTYAYDLIETLKNECFVPTATQKLPDYEAALGLSSGYIAQYGTTAQRRASIISKFRESGAFTNANTRAILGPLLGYVDPSALQIIETSRADLETAHTYAMSDNHNVSAGTDDVTTVYMLDGGTISRAGLRFRFRIVSSQSGSEVAFTLRAPDGTTKTWPAGTFDVADISSVGFRYLYTHAFDGLVEWGTWTLTLHNSSGSTLEFDYWDIFAEGDGPYGLGTAIYDWGAYADPGLVGGNGVIPDYPSVNKSIQRIKHAHTTGNVLLSLAPYPDTDTGIHAAIPDACIPQ